MKHSSQRAQYERSKNTQELWCSRPLRAVPKKEQ